MSGSDEWLRALTEALRRADPKALFWLDFDWDARRAEGSADELDADAFRAEVDEWLAELDPDEPPARRSFQPHGISVRLQARGRSPQLRGWTGKPSLTALEPVLPDLHLVDGRRRPFVALTLEEVDALAAGQTRLVGQLSSYATTFGMLADEMRAFAATSVAELDPAQIENYAGLLGLVESPPGAGTFEQGFRAINDVPPDE